MRVVIDTSALVSAIRSSSGAAAEILRRVLLGKLTILLDYKLACEYRTILFRDEHVAVSGKTPDEIEELILLLEDIALPVRVVAKYRPLCTDQNDDMVMDIAINGSADAILTNNVRDFQVAGKRFSIPVFTPRDFLIICKKGDLLNEGKSQQI
jgi:putative PIN family toxin of toxin-antitoxin system